MSATIQTSLIQMYLDLIQSCQTTVDACSQAQTEARANLDSALADLRFAELAAARAGCF